MASRMSISGVASTVRHLESLRDRVSEDRMQRIVSAVAEMGLSVAQAGYSKAEYPGPNDVRVSIVTGGDGATYLVASGTRVLFIEFGSGVNLPDTNPWASSLGIYPGGFSSGKIRPSGWWLYRGERGGVKDGNISPVVDRDRYGNVTKVREGRWWTQGNASANAMYEASKKMRDALADAVTRIWGDAR
ncbi:hypothetical protein DXD59_00535 [Olsenella sp. TM06-36]|nr:hypothetical protein DXD59_00535 [Olsenella sp. TM06-36]